MEKIKKGIMEFIYTSIYFSGHMLLAFFMGYFWYLGVEFIINGQMVFGICVMTYLPIVTYLGVKQK